MNFIFMQNVEGYPSKRKLKKLNNRQLKKQELLLQYVSFNLDLCIHNPRYIELYLEAVKEGKLDFLLKYFGYKNREKLIQDYLNELENSKNKEETFVFEWFYDLFLNYIEHSKYKFAFASTSIKLDNINRVDLGSFSFYFEENPLKLDIEKFKNDFKAFIQSFNNLLQSIFDKDVSIECSKDVEVETSWSKEYCSAYLNNKVCSIRYLN